MRRKSHKTPLLGMKFDRDPQQLEFFLAQVGTYMQDYGPEIVTEGDKLRCVTMALEGAAVRWMVTLHNDNTPCYNCFMAACCKCFEDPLVNIKARDHIKTISQGQRSVAKYTQEFHNLAC